MRKLLVIIILFVNVAGFAQQQVKFLSIDFGLGSTELGYSLRENGITNRKLGASVNTSYTYFFKIPFGVKTGIGLQSYTSSCNLTYLDRIAAVDDEGETYEYRINFKRWEEQQTAYFLTIPLSAVYMNRITPKFGVMASLGGQWAFPLMVNYKTVGGEFETTGYYERLNVEFNNQPKRGFTTYNDTKTGNYLFRPAVSLIADAGGIFRLGNRLDLYVGGYLNYAFNNALRTDIKNVYQQNQVYNGVLASSLVTGAHPFSVGAKVGIYFHWEKPIPKASDAPKLYLPEKDPVNVSRVAAEKFKVSNQKNVFIVKGNNNEDIIVEPESADVISSAKLSAMNLQMRYGFEFGKATAVDPEKLRPMSEVLTAHPKLILRIVGHTCNIGSHEQNYKIGMLRAMVVKEGFIALGVNPQQIIAVSKSYDEPLVPNTSEENRSKNRRVDFEIINLVAE